MAEAKQTQHETLSVTTVQTPATTRALLEAYGCEFVICTTTADVRYTIDGQTTPVITGAAEVGSLLLAASNGIILTILDFLNSKWTSVSGTARVQFEFSQGNIHRM